MPFCADNYSGQHLLFSNSYYVERLSLDGTRTRTIYSGLTFAFGVDFNIRCVSYIFRGINGWMTLLYNIISQNELFVLE